MSGGLFPLLCLTWNNCDKWTQHLCGWHFELLFSTSRCSCYVSVVLYFICCGPVRRTFLPSCCELACSPIVNVFWKAKEDLWIVVAHFVRGCCQGSTGTRPLRAPADAHLRCFYLWFCHCSLIYSCVSCPAKTWSDRKRVCGWLRAILPLFSIRRILVNSIKGMQAFGGAARCLYFIFTGINSSKKGCGWYQALLGKCAAYACSPVVGQNIWWR